MPQCYVTTCANYYGKTRGNSKVIYHMIPTSPALAMKWAKASGRKDVVPPQYARVCSEHFSPGCYQRDLQHELLGLPLRRKLKTDAVPDRNIPGVKTKEKILKPKEDVGVVKNNNKVNRLPMRSSIRIAKKKSIESLSDSFVSKVNSKATNSDVPERFSDKLKFMAKLQLRHQRNASLLQPQTNLDTYIISSSSESEDSYERDVQHEILGLPTRCRLKKGAIPEKNLPTDFLKEEEEVQESAIAILLAVGLVPTANPTEKISGGLPQDLNKMQIMEDVREGCNVQPSSPGHAEQRANDDPKSKTETLSENGFEEQNSNTDNNDGNSEDQKEDNKPSENEGDDAPENSKTESPEVNNEENYSNASSPSAESNKRKSDAEDFPVKRLRTEIHQNFLSRDKILNEFIEMAECNNLEQIHTFSEQLLAEIKTLNELAKEKEREWNNILHLKKIKEELLLRMQRKRQIMLINEKSDYADLLTESQGDNADERSKSGSPHSILKSNLTNPQKSALRIPNVSLNGDKSKHRTILPKLPQSTLELNGSLDLRQAKQRPILDVQSIIADYRQRHPEAVPRRGRRIRNSQTDGSNKSSSVLNFASMTLGSGSQVRQNLQGIDMSSEIGMLLSTMNGNRSDYSKAANSDSSASAMQDTTSFRDMLLQFAKLSQNERTELMQNFKPPPPYPEVTVHPVPTTTAAPTNSLLHGILTKSPSKQNNKTSFSPTLARLLTAPERAVNNPVTSTPTMSGGTVVHPSNMSISEILSTSKARNEITITPVGTQYESTPTKVRSAEEEEAEDSADRLVIDESSDAAESRRAADNNSETGDEVPPCQGCNQKPAQFVCAGCGNQWYCSRDCQVSAWDEHSEVCSG